MKFSGYIQDINLCSIVLRMVLTILLSGLIGYERGKHGKVAGMRTHILIGIGSCITAIISLYVNKVLGYPGDIFRISAQVVSGIGFLGTGTILIKNKSMVTGLTTAACVWTTGVMGLAVGYGLYLEAIIASVLIMITVETFGVIDRKMRRQDEFTLYVEFKDAVKLNDTIDEMAEKGLTVVSIQPTAAKANMQNAIGADVVVLYKKGPIQSIINIIKDFDNISFVIVT